MIIKLFKFFWKMSLMKKHQFPTHSWHQHLCHVRVMSVLATAIQFVKGIEICWKMRQGGNATIFQSSSNFHMNQLVENAFGKSQRAP